WMLMPRSLLQSWSSAKSDEVLVGPRWPLGAFVMFAFAQPSARTISICQCCLRYRAGLMSLTCTEEAYPERRMFECPVCGDTMTQWVNVPLASDKRRFRLTIHKRNDRFGS